MNTLLYLAVAGCCLSAQAQLPNAPSASTPQPPAKRRSIGPYLGSGMMSDAYEPLSTGQKFAFAARQAFGPVTYPEVALVAAINQVSNGQPSWGQGAEGFGKRYGAAFADQAINTMVSAAVVPSLLKQDPRYFRRASGTFGQRVGYAISRLWLTRRDDGSQTANFSPVIGALVTAGVSRAYYPAADRNAPETFRVGAFQLATDVAWNGLYEFWPDVRHAVFHK